MKKPIQRSRLRLFLGKIYYWLKKKYYWHLSGVKFAKKQERDLCPYQVFTYQTVLRRKLKEVDMWMQENKITNLKLASKKINGLIIRPGETFSYWRQIGSVTEKKGYLPGMVLHDGQVKSGVGGGLCQLSNLIFWLALHSPLTITERWRHGYDVFPDVKRNQPFGSGATCTYPNIDLEIKNNTQNSFQLKLEIDEEFLRGTFLSDHKPELSYQIVEKDHIIRQEWWGKYTRNNKIFRKVFDHSGQEIAEEFVTANQAIMMYEPLLES